MSCRVCQQTIIVPALDAHWHRHPELTCAPPPRPAHACRHCDQVLADADALRCHEIAEHFRPDTARATRIAFLRGRWRRLVHEVIV